MFTKDEVKNCFLITSEGKKKCLINSKEGCWQNLFLKNTHKMDMNEVRTTQYGYMYMYFEGINVCKMAIIKKKLLMLVNKCITNSYTTLFPLMDMVVLS